MTGEPLHTTSEMAPRAPVISEKLRIHYASLSAMFSPLHRSTIQELFKKHLCNQNSHYEKYGFHYKGKSSRAHCQIDNFAVSKDDWDTKEDTGKSMKNALYVLWYAKRHL